MASGGSSPGGTAAPTTRAIYTGSAVTITSGGTAFMTLDAKSSGTALLDISAPATPTVVTAGVYAVTIEIQPQDSLTVGGAYTALLGLDSSGSNAVIQADSPAATIASDSPQLAIALTYYLPAASELTIRVRNHDGAATRDFAVGAFVIQRIS